MSGLEISTEMARAYDPSLVEDRIYTFWDNNGYFSPVIDKDKQPFVLIMPPPNVTGELHMGHALTLALEDMMVRWHRMKGDPTLFLPGTDHAGIATQVVVERLLATEGLTRHDIGREEFEKRIWKWVDQYGQRIYEQIRHLGVSCDWSRKAFTLDEGPRKAVRKTFVDLYKKDLIYQGERITNWCPRCTTVLSELEVKYKEVSGSLVEIDYPFFEESGHLTIATTRPETMLGDAAVAVNPNDERFSSFIGKKILLPLTERVIPVIGDESVDIEFGTGALKVTPAHDPVDFEIGQRHHLPFIEVIDKNVQMTGEIGKFAGLNRDECRRLVLEDLEKLGLLRDIKQFEHAVGHCDRCDEIIEPLISQQWYVSMEPLAAPAREAVRNGSIEIIPDRFKSVYFNWMDNIRDWPVSRQLWWGHQLPVWYCRDCDQVIVEYEDPSFCTKCQSKNLQRDEDVLDTWFSSGLWPHSTLGWPDSTEDLDYFYPGSVLETGYDILFFWVARMVMLGIFNMGDIPFHTIYLHGLVLDPDGVKMSKTKGNVLDPLEIIDQYGSDAVRFALTTGTSAGNNVRISEGRLESRRNFANKLWNAARFVIARMEAEGSVSNWINPKPSHLHDRWILSRLQGTAENTNRLIGDHQFGDAQREVHDFFWNEYCDWYIELAKLRFDDPNQSSPLDVLIHVLESSLRLLHPFMPFVTEEIWQILASKLPSRSKMPNTIMLTSYLNETGNNLDLESESDLNKVFELIGAVRNIRGELRIPQNEILDGDIFSTHDSGLIGEHSSAIQKLAGMNVTIWADALPSPTSGIVSLITSGVSTSLKVGSSVDLENELGRLKTENSEIDKYIKSINKRLKNQGFISKAPEEVIQKERSRLDKAEGRRKLLEDILKKLI